MRKKIWNWKRFMIVILTRDLFITKTYQFKVEDFFCGIISKDSISPEQISKLKILLSQKNINNIFSINADLFKPREEKDIDFQPSAPPNFNF